MLRLSIKRAIPILFLMGVLAIGPLAGQPGSIAGAQADHLELSAQTVASTYYLPLLVNRHPWITPFGFEVSANLGQNTTLFNRAVNLQAAWVRLNNRISWRALQPVEGGAIQWSKLAAFENELRALKSASLIPVVIVDDYPYWAVQIARKDGKPTSCGPLRSDKFYAFAAFLRALVARYKTVEFNVHHWELGNEPDVDPDLVSIDSVFGCWGDIDDPYYGGRHYGSMLNVVTPAIKAEDPWAKVWIGGLLLDSPFTNDPKQGRPELFLQGILLAGAAANFDVLPYHWYPSYYQLKVDYDLGPGSKWESWGGGTVGKARYLRQIMQAFGVSKPLSLNETGLGCPNDTLVYDWCVPPAGPRPEFFDMQADYVVRSFTRGLGEGVSSFFWYTLDGPGWRYISLLDEYGNPKPVYYAYQHLISKLQNTRYLGRINYGTDIEAYAFRKGTSQVHILWTIEDKTVTISVPEAKFIAAYNRDGALINLTPSGGSYQIPVGFSPIFVLRMP